MAARTTQEVVESVYEVAASVRTTQVGAEAVYEVAPTVRVTQGVGEAVYEVAARVLVTQLAVEVVYPFPGSTPPVGGSMTKLDIANAFLADLFARRGNSDPGGLAHSQVRIFGGEVVEATAFEPDPSTYRRNYYYNVVTNRLYRRVVADSRPEAGVVKAVWQAIGG